ncbi:ATP-NAD kinase-like domain-containing protein [Fimicolochytrium jonesii]|uniref:ATP-NAD kinase-like domain-containing protein n=1 Tax=Fimicolochytrium jonesii TaxID=1396493 RepID=UPI0022FE4427|nr:ATP-NAD kinase-like domain-containing protein [Fimicolochytrium jonesii]KAI8819659.1 ATP-NAD kinase-like domain-containing protein [Fimicolochytrium jonesii]
MLESPFSYDREDRDSEGKLYRSGSQQTLSRQSVAENPTVARLARGDDASNGCPNITPFQSANGSGGDNPLAETRSGGAPPSRRRSRSNSHSELAKTAVGLREIARKIGRAQLIWDRPPKSVLIVTKLHDPQLVKITHHVAKWLITDVQLTVYVEERLKSDPSFRYEQIAEELRSHERAANTNKKAPSKIDFVITLGGDGTVLFAAWLFQNKCPPLLPFRLGSLGFLTTFDFAVFRKTITETVMETGLTKGLRMNFRMRFSCTIRRYNGGSAQPKNAVSNGKSNDTSEDDPDHNTTYQILNDLTIDRGPSPFMSQLELYGNDTHLTTVHADGLIISTPTGSTAYSLSSGGSLVHPDVSAILVTPICPHTLSFRPMILPDTMELRIAVPSDSRATAYASFDGRKRVCLGKGDCVVVKAANWPVPSVCWEDQSRDWFRGLERCLGWNRRERQQGLDDGGDRDEGDDGQMDMEW